MTEREVDLVGEGMKLLRRCHKAAVAYGRDDLAARVVSLADRLGDDAHRVMVVGEFKHGKSSLVNALLGDSYSPVDADIATSAPIVFRHAAQVRGEALVETIGDGMQRVAFALDELATWATEGGNPENVRRVRRVDLYLDHPILEAGIAFIDTPGVGGLASAHGTITAAALPMADAVIFVSDAAQELSGNEVEFLRLVRSICPRVAYAVTKIDLHHHWRRIAELDAGHLERLGITLPTFAVSSHLRDLATDADDEATADVLADESGFGPLIRWLGREVARRGKQRSAGLIAAEVDQVADQLLARFLAERDAAASTDPEQLLADLTAAKHRADQLKGTAGRWSQRMSDGFGDLSSDIDHDLRLRMRDLTRKMEERIDATDPAESWAEFEPWLYGEVGAAVTANYAELCGRIDELVTEVCQLFGDDTGGAGFTARISTADDVVGAAAVEAELELKKATVVAQGLSVLRGGYSSVGMFSMYAGMAGIALTNPVSAALALVMGRKGLRDERERQLGQRRAQAKAAAKRYLDEINFLVGKDSRDTMRHLQRDLREYFSNRADEATRSAAAAVTAAADFARQSETERQATIAAADAEIARLQKLKDSAAALAGLTEQEARR